jgi:hypothetical protein
LVFYYRNIDNFGNLVWEPIKFNKSNLIERVKLHENNQVDVALINLSFVV